MVRFASLAAGLVLAGAAQAAFMDTMDSAVNFSGAFNGVTATAQGNGTVVLARSQASVDAGINWTKGGSRFSLATEPLLSVKPSAPVNGGYYSSQILFYNASGGYLSEVTWVTDTNSTALRTIDLSSWASTPAAAAQYAVRFRVLPWNSSNGAFAFDEMNTAAVPEPATAGAVGMGLSALCMLRRRRA